MYIMWIMFDWIKCITVFHIKSLYLTVLKLLYFPSNIYHYMSLTVDPFPNQIEWQLFECVINTSWLIIKGYIFGVWLGFSDVQREGHMVSVSDRRRPGYVNWIKGQPDNYGGNEDCAMYWKDLTGWNDSPCSTKINFVCTKK